MTAAQKEMIEHTTQDIAGYLVEDYCISIKQALDVFFLSKTFEKLSNVNTGIYLQGPAYVYEMLKEESMRSYCSRKEGAIL